MRFLTTCLISLCPLQRGSLDNNALPQRFCCNGDRTEQNVERLRYRAGANLAGVRVLIICMVLITRFLPTLDSCVLPAKTQQRRRNRSEKMQKDILASRIDSFFEKGSPSFYCFQPTRLCLLLRLCIYLPSPWQRIDCEKR